MPVSVISRHRKRGVSTAAVRQQARRLLQKLGERPAELTIVLVGDADIQQLNRDYRGKNHSTDVLAFAMREGERVGGDERLLGDVVISLDTAARQARRRRASLAAEVAALMVHGVLHLLGYDHERSAPEARRMRRKERELMAALSVRPARS